VHTPRLPALANAGKEAVGGAIRSADREVEMVRCVREGGLGPGAVVEVVVRVVVALPVESASELEDAGALLGGLGLEYEAMSLAVVAVPSEGRVKPPGTSVRARGIAEPVVAAVLLEEMLRLLSAVCTAAEARGNPPAQVEVGYQKDLVEAARSDTNPTEGQPPCCSDEAEAILVFQVHESGIDPLDCSSDG